MTYIFLFLPSIVAVVGLCISLIYGRSKNAFIVAAVPAMVVFLLVKDTMAAPKAVNCVVLTFVLIYLIISLVLSIKTRKEGDDQ